jgi:hypothetical protein
VRLSRSAEEATAPLLGRVLTVYNSKTPLPVPDTVQQIVQYSCRQTEDQDRSGQNRDQEVFGWETGKLGAIREVLMGPW